MEKRQTKITQILCGNCKIPMVKVKEWELKGRGKGGTIIELFKCEQCGVHTRRSKKKPKKVWGSP